MPANVWATVGGVVGYIPVTALTGTADQLFGMNGAGTLATWKNAKYKDSSGQLYVPAGAVGTPSYSWAGSLTSGFYLTGADSIGVAIAGVNAATLDAAKLALVKHLQLTGKLVMEDQGANIACAATTDLGTATGNFLTLTNAAGATNITSLGGDTFPAGTEIEVVMSITGGSVTFVHNATDLICLGGGNVACIDKDIFRFRKINDAAAKWQMVGIARGINTSSLTTAGDLLVGLGGGNVGRFGVGTDGMQTFASSDPAEKMLWLPGATGISIVNGCLVASVAGNALTIALKGWNGADPSVGNPVFVIFRDATLTNGTPTSLKVITATSIVVSSGSTLGGVNAIPLRIWVIGFNDAGVFRLGVVNTQATASLESSKLASSTAEGGAGGADTAGVIYTGVAVANKAMRVLGYVEYNPGLAAAGTYATAPTKAQLLFIDNAKPPYHGYFSAHKNGVNQADGGNGINTKVTATTEEADTDGVYDAANSKFIPGLGERWIINCTVNETDSSAGQSTQVMLFKNGAAYKQSGINTSGGTTPVGASFSFVIEGNGADFYEMYFLRGNSTSAGVINGATTHTHFSGIRIG